MTSTTAGPDCRVRRRASIRGAREAAAGKPAVHRECGAFSNHVSTLRSQSGLPSLDVFIAAASVEQHDRFITLDLVLLDKLLHTDQARATFRRGEDAFARGDIPA